MLQALSETANCAKQAIKKFESYLLDTRQRPIKVGSRLKGDVAERVKGWHELEICSTSGFIATCDGLCVLSGTSIERRQAEAFEALYRDYLCHAFARALKQRYIQVAKIVKFLAASQTEFGRADPQTDEHRDRALQLLAAFQHKEGWWPAAIPTDDQMEHRKDYIELAGRHAVGTAEATIVLAAHGKRYDGNVQNALNWHWGYLDDVVDSRRPSSGKAISEHLEDILCSCWAICTVGMGPRDVFSEHRKGILSSCFALFMEEPLLMADSPTLAVGTDLYGFPIAEINGQEDWAIETYQKRASLVATITILNAIKHKIVHGDVLFHCLEVIHEAMRRIEECASADTRSHTFNSRRPQFLMSESYLAWSCLKKMCDLLEENGQELLAMNYLQIASDYFPNRQYMEHPSLCFVLMPFTEKHSNGDLITGHPEIVWDSIVTAAENARRAGCTVEVERSTSSLSGAYVMQGIWDKICRSKALIVDISGSRPNVAYELGIARALGKNVFAFSHHKPATSAENRKQGVFANFGYQNLPGLDFPVELFDLDSTDDCLILTKRVDAFLQKHLAAPQKKRGNK